MVAKSPASATSLDMPVVRNRWRVGNDALVPPYNRVSRDGLVLSPLFIFGGC